MSSQYFLSLGSNRKLSPEVIQKTLSGEAIQRIVFPAVGHYTDLTDDEWRQIDRTGSAEGFEHRFKTMPVQGPDDYDPSLLLKQKSQVLASTVLTFGSKNTGSLRISLSWSNLPGSSISLIFPEECLLTGSLTSTSGLELFQELVLVFEPYVVKLVAPGSSGSHTLFFRQETKFAWQLYELDIDWLTYYGPEFLALVGKGRIERLQGHVSHFEYFEDGILVGIVEDTFDSQNPEHMHKLARARELLDFAEIATEVRTNTIKVIG